MPDEEIDKLLRDAANQHHPPYDDTAWGKMETLLDKHLPEKKDRKRPVFFLLLFLLVGGAIFWGMESAQKNNSKTTIAEKAADKNRGASAASSIPTANNIATNQNNTTSVQSYPSVANSLNVNAPNGSANDDQYVNGRKNGYNNASRNKVKIKNGVATADDDNIPPQKNSVTKSDDGNNVPSTADNKNDIVVVDKNDNTITKKQEVTAKKSDSVSVATDNQKKADEKSNTTTSASNQKKNNKTVADKFAITASAGADLSYVTLNNAGKVKPVYGAGVRYAVGKHVVISSGLNVSKKVYTALPTQYKFVGYTNPNLVKISANCNVYEIPLTVYYNFKQVKNHGWFAGVGLSSFLMKKESYDYYYENPTGQPYSYDKTVTNENKHFLSVLSLSAGYQYKLNNRVSFMAEPYLKVPLSGIGLGKIKLNSTGVMLTAAVKPFSKKKK